MLYQTQLAQVRPYQQQINNMPASYQTSTSEQSITPPVTCSPQAYSWLHQQRIISPLALDYQTAYRCNFVGQLQGNYEVDVAAGVDRINVIISTVPEGEHSFAIVRQVCSDGEALPDQFIYEDMMRFNLCSTDNSRVGVMMKGMNMKYRVEWSMVDGSKTIWRRSGDVVFNLVSVDSLVPSRRGSMSSVTSMSSLLSNGPEDKHHHLPGLLEIRPELLRDFPRYKDQRRDFISNPPSVISSTDESHLQQRRLHIPAAIQPRLHIPATIQPNLTTTTTSLSNLPVPAIQIPTNTAAAAGHSSPVTGLTTVVPLSPPPVKEKPKSEEEIFNSIKKLCRENPVLLKKVLKWGNNQSSATELTKEGLEKLSSGRLWVTASLGHPATESEEDVKWQDTLDDLKGAYQVATDDPNTYIQPLPQQSEPGKQHRLKKNERDLWVIGEKVKTDSKWYVCAKQLPNRQWIDLRHERRPIEVKVVSLLRILERMGERLTTDQNQDVEKCVQFLFNSCNQKKLNSKLKTRNLKHNIANLKVKLDKQYSLSFAVKVANTADIIAQEERGK